MIKRIVEISQHAHLSLRNQQLVIERADEEPAQIAIEDLGVLILDHYSITHTQQLLSACWQNNVAVILCDGKHLPGAVLLPLDGHSLQSKIVAQQVEVTEPTRKRLWQTIVQAKVREQANVLRSVHGECDPLPAYADKVRSAPETGGAASTLTTMPVSHDHGGRAIAVDASFVYFNDRIGNTVQRVSKIGGVPIVVATASGPTGIALDQSYVYFTNQGDGTIRRATK